MDKIASVVDTPTISIKHQSDIVEIIPYLLGFHPASSVVVIACRGSEIVMTLRADIDAAQPDHERNKLARDVSTLITQQKGTDVILAGFHDDRELAGEYLTIFEECLDGFVIIDSLEVSGDRSWSRRCHDTDCCDASGHRFSTNGSRVAAQAVFAGLDALPDRDALRDKIAPPKGKAATRAAKRCDKAEEVLLAMSEQAATDLLGELFARGLGDVSSLSDDEFAMLGVAVNYHRWRDPVLMALDRRNIDPHLRLWQCVARSIPRARQSPVLCMYGMASWIEGSGAMASICAEEASRIDASVSLLGILSDILHSGAHPRIWDGVVHRSAWDDVA